MTFACTAHDRTLTAPFSSLLKLHFVVYRDRPDQKIHRKKWTFNYNLWSWGKAEISGRCFQSSLCVLKQRISICIPPFFFSSAFSSAFSSRIILMASVRPSCHAINRFHKYPPPHVLYNCFRFLVKILVNTSDKSAELQKMRRGKNRGRESKADRWTTNVEESSPAEKYSKVWSSIPSMLHFFFPPFKFIFLLQLDSEYLCWHSVLQQFNFLPIFPEFRLDFSHFHVAALYLDELVWTAGLVQDFLIQAVHIFYITEKCFDAPQVCKTQFRSFVDPRKHHHTASRQALKYVFSLNSSCYATNMNSIQKCLTT